MQAFLVLLVFAILGPPLGAAMLLGMRDHGQARAS